MTHVSIIGNGAMGQAIAGLVTAGGNTVETLGRADADKALTGDVVVLAVPYPELAAVLEAHREHLAGKVVVDITNPLNFETFDSLTVAADGSAAAELAEALPQSQVLKAFNTNFAATLASGKVGDVPTTVLIAGDDDAAKQTLVNVVRSGGVRAVDAGTLKRARELEAIGFLQLTLAAGEKIAWTDGFALI